MTEELNPLAERLVNLDLEIQLLKASLNHARVQCERDPLHQEQWQKQITKLENRLQRMEQTRQRWLDELSTPQLKQRIQALETRVLVLQQRVEQLEQENFELREKAQEFQELQDEHEFLNKLYREQLKNVALLSIHQKQNIENYSKLVLDIGQRLKDANLSVIAKASKSSLDPNGEYVQQSGLNSYGINPKIDQVLFPLSIKKNRSKYLLLLIINANTSTFSEGNLSVKLYDTCQKKLLDSKDFEFFQNQEAVDYFVNLYHEMK
ncbi:hypothetical protein K4A83_01550 [Spirulina subsalsa FACHB-351]|uniref:Uncharacterized protein n=1 Tax=Spirulina subsalsa FACHB-351 TaxID=234711 RepID=A0ABT3L1F9_9CYAN|nr:hypothetical protein [Spirulina subsalsa]MCW6034959.1 hypothetical protein [Spirulina subsalsa FACHB-351]